MRFNRPTFGQLLLVAAMLLAPWATAHAACDGEPWISLEIVAGELAGDALAEFIEVDQEGCVLSFYPEFDLRAGLYERQLSRGERQGLSDAVSDSDALVFNPAALRARLQQRAQPVEEGGLGQLYYVAGADSVKLRINTGNAEQLIEWPSPELYAELIVDDIPLQKLAALISRIRAEGADPRRNRTGVQP